MPTGHTHLRRGKAWYDSPAYRKVREHRYKGADYRAVIKANDFNRSRCEVWLQPKSGHA
jgi:hypothetical protein